VTRAELLEALLVERTTPIPAHRVLPAAKPPPPPDPPDVVRHRRRWLASMHDPDRKDRR
jgi:hypothetical protein